MTLENLLGIGLVRRHPVDADEIRRLLQAAVRNMVDARVIHISPETRFHVAYKAIMQVSLAAMMAHGFRPVTSQPGHHMTVMQSLPKTIGLGSDRLKVLDALRRKRNAADYAGDEIDSSLAEQCADEAEALIDDVSEFMKARLPDF